MGCPGTNSCFTFNQTAVYEIICCCACQVIDQPIYVELIIKAKDPQTTNDDDDWKRGDNETKTRLSMQNDTRHADVLAAPYIDEVCWIPRYKSTVQSNLPPYELMSTSRSEANRFAHS